MWVLLMGLLCSADHFGLIFLQYPCAVSTPNLHFDVELKLDHAQFLANGYTRNVNQVVVMGEVNDL